MRVSVDSPQHPSRSDLAVAKARSVHHRSDGWVESLISNVLEETCQYLMIKLCDTVGYDLCVVERIRNGDI